MGNAKIAGGSFLSNLQGQRFELNENTDLKMETLVEIEVSEKDIEQELDIKNYLDKPIELLIKDATENELLDTEINFYLEEKEQDVIDIDFIDIIEEIPFLDNEITSETNYNGIEMLEMRDTTEENPMILLKSLQEQIDTIQLQLKERDQKLNQRDQEIVALKNENKGLQKTLIREQDIVMKEQDLHDKTLSRVEQLLLEKRSELIERQKASKRNWFLKFIDKVKS